MNLRHACGTSRSFVWSSEATQNILSSSFSMWKMSRLASRSIVRGRLQRSEWKNHSDRGRRYGRRCPLPLNERVTLHPHDLQAKLFVHCLTIVRTVFGYSLKQYFLFSVQILFWLWIIQDEWPGPGRTNNTKGRPWHQWYFMIAAEIFDILFIQTDPHKP